MHPTKRIQCIKSDSLFGKTIVLGVTGSIAAVKTIELARELIRHGAEVQAVMSLEAQKIIHPNALEYATGKKAITMFGKKQMSALKKMKIANNAKLNSLQLNALKKATKNKVISKLDGKIQHVRFCGIEGEADLLLIAPATANTVSKIAMGIDDTVVTTFASTALGSKIPIIVVPAMHESMYENKAVVQNLKRLKKFGVKIIEPLHEENKAKFPSIEEIVLECERAILSKHSNLNKKKILIASGATSVEIDPLRVLTNKSSGKTGIELAKEAHRKGANITLIHNREIFFSGIKNICANSIEAFEKAVFFELNKGYDFFLLPAAVSDFSVEKSKVKIKFSGKLKLTLFQRNKIIDFVVKKFPKIFIVAFKAETNASQKQLLESAKHLLSKIPKGFVVANNAEDSMGKDCTKALIVSKDGFERFEGTKIELAEKIFEKISLEK